MASFMMLSVMAIIFAMFGPMDSLPLNSTNTACTGQELLKRPAEMKYMFNISQNLHNHTSLSAEDISTWLDFREELKKEISTERCKTFNGGNFCCQICLLGGKSMFCSHSDFLSESGTLSDKRILDTKSRALQQVNEQEGPVPLKSTVYLGEDEVIVDLFAVKCDSPMQEQVCSEYVRPHALILDEASSFPNFSDSTFSAATRT